MKALRTVAALVCFAMMARPSLRAEDKLVAVHVIGPAVERFTDQASKQRDELRRALLDQLRKKKKLLTVVDNRESAAVLLDVKESTIVDGDIETRANPIGGGVRSRAQKEFRGVIVLTVGDYSTELKEQGLFSAVIAGKLADDVEKWTKDNRDRLR